MTTFETTIQTYLENRAKEDSLFAETYKKANKSIKECCKYIYSRARKLAAGGNADMINAMLMMFIDRVGSDDMMAYKIYEYLKTYPSKLGLDTDFDWAFEHVFRKEEQK